MLKNLKRKTLKQNQRSYSILVQFLVKTFYIFFSVLRRTTTVQGPKKSVDRTRSLKWIKKKLLFIHILIPLSLSCSVPSIILWFFLLTTTNNNNNIFIYIKCKWKNHPEKPTKRKFVAFCFSCLRFLFFVFALILFGKYSNQVMWIVKLKKKLHGSLCNRIHFKSGIIEPAELMCWTRK